MTLWTPSRISSDSETPRRLAARARSPARSLGTFTVLITEAIGSYYDTVIPLSRSNQAISVFVNCETQQEVGELSETLSEGGAKQQSGWLKDNNGLPWQIIPTALGKATHDTDPDNEPTGKSLFAFGCSPFQLRERR